MKCDREGSCDKCFVEHECSRQVGFKITLKDFLKISLLPLGAIVIGLAIGGLLQLCPN